MIYAEFLRVRGAFYIFAAIVAGVALIITISGHAAHGGHGVVFNVDNHDVLTMSRPHAPAHAVKRTGVPLAFLFGIAGFIAIAFSTVVAASLNRENERAGFVFTKPVSRVRLALEYMSVDLAAIVAAFVYALVVLLLAPLASFGGLPALVMNRQAVATAFLGLGAAFLWYGVLQAVTAGYCGRGGKFVGFSWLAFGLLAVLASVTQLGPIFHTLVMVLNAINPFAYFFGIVAGTDATRAALTWCIAALGCALAIFAWKRVEA